MNPPPTFTASLRDAWHGAKALVGPPILAFMTQPDERGHPEPPLAGDEIDTLLGSLERQRATFAWKCGGLDGRAPT